MSEPAKFALKDTLWRNLPSQYLEDSLLCSSPQDAVKWLLVSKDIKEVIEENRDKMPLFKKGGFYLEMKDHDWITMKCEEYDRSFSVRCYEKANDPAPTSSMLECNQGHSAYLYKWRLVDTSVAGIKRFISRISQWFPLKEATFPWNCVDPEVLRPLAEKDVCIKFECIEEYDDSVMDAIESLHIKNIGLNDAYGEATLSDSFLRRIYDMPLEKIACCGDSRLLKHLNCSSISFEVLMPWFDGERPSLKFMRLEFSDEGEYDAAINWPLFEPVDYVPKASEMDVWFDNGREHDYRFFHFYNFTDKTGKRHMEIKAQYCDYSVDSDLTVYKLELCISE